MFMQVLAWRRRGLGQRHLDRLLQRVRRVRLESLFQLSPQDTGVSIGASPQITHNGNGHASSMPPLLDLKLPQSETPSLNSHASPMPPLPDVKLPPTKTLSSNGETSPMPRIVGLGKKASEKSLRRSRALEGRMHLVSRMIWPWNDRWLIPLVALLGALDLISTYLLLELSGKVDVYESGLLANWALKMGGFNGLYIMNAVAVGLLCLIAVSARLYYGRFGLLGLARTAYVAVLLPYAITAFAAVVNNLLLTVI